MVYAFAFPFIGGALPFLGLGLYKRDLPGKVPCDLYHAGIATLTVGSFFQGALEIYGTTNRLVAVYWWLGAALVSLGTGLYAISVIMKKRI